MKHLMLAFAALAICATPALAADKVVKKKRPSPFKVKPGKRVKKAPLRKGAFTKLPKTGLPCSASPNSTPKDGLHTGKVSVQWTKKRAAPPSNKVVAVVISQPDAKRPSKQVLCSSDFKGNTLNGTVNFPAVKKGSDGLYTCKARLTKKSCEAPPTKPR